MELSDLNTAMQAAFAKLQQKNEALATRIQELEQRGAARHGGAGAIGDPDAIIDAIERAEGFKALRNGEAKSVRIAIPANALKLKSITSDISGGTIAAPDRSPDIVVPSQRRLRIRDLLPVVPTSGGSTQFVRELVYTNNAGPQYDAGSPGPFTEGATKNLSDMSFELITSPIVTLAHAFTVSRQALDDSAALRAHIESRGLWGLAIEEETELLLGDGSSGKLDGLIHNATAFNAGATNQTLLDTIRKAITQVALSDHIASAVVLNPKDAETMELSKDSQGRYLGVVLNLNGQPTVWRIAVIESNTMTAGSFLVGDFAMAATIRDRQQATVEISLDHASYRLQNLALVLIEERIGLEIHRPTALVYGSTSFAG